MRVGRACGLEEHAGWKGPGTTGGNRPASATLLEIVRNARKKTGEILLKTYQLAPRSPSGRATLGEQIGTPQADASRWQGGRAQEVDALEGEVKLEKIATADKKLRGELKEPLKEKEGSTHSTKGAAHAVGMGREEPMGKNLKSLTLVKIITK
jgi:hypothetical protein